VGANFVEAFADFVAGEFVTGDERLLDLREIHNGVAGKAVEGGGAEGPRP